MSTSAQGQTDFDAQRSDVTAMSQNMPLAVTQEFTLIMMKFHTHV